ncbi:hypothetical protein CWE08_06590 [Aliidiomarina iranensis]|uniref:Uncharacterized protein n=1 Tax=Aliidiomarina iranensis TaxID=1434071 RepID=A0A432VX03_9GAMM|nr:pilus assembly protein N-terminal domain-containing protein [Aliidiomarina iranensis]RUO21244.1 hypothetical protein CWE08_06590 [Aliidiomarina iranensis]
MPATAFLRSMMLLIISSLFLINGYSFSAKANDEISVNQEPKSLAVGSAEMIYTEEKIIRVALANPSIAEARLINDKELMIMALAAGQTDVIWWLESGGHEKIQVQVHAPTDVSLRATLEQITDTAPLLSVTWQRGQPILSGEVDEYVFARLEKLKADFSSLNIANVELKNLPKATLELAVKVYEVNRRSLRQLGLNWQQSIAGPALGVISDWHSGNRFRAIGEQALNTVPGAESLLAGLPQGQYGYLGWNTSLASTLQMIQERGEGRVLATPKLRVESGESAEFLAGGEIPIPQITLQGATQVDFKNYGIYLKVAPVKLADGRIRTQVISELSQPDLGIAVQGVPGLRTRRTETMVTVNEGETLVIAGLVSHEESEVHSGIPGAGRWLSNRDQQAQETELVVFITPIDVHEQTARYAEQLEQQAELLQSFNALGCTGMLEVEEKP